ncbi:hypothetical protein ACI50E_16795 [Brucella sp. ZJ1_1]|uniref:hypothetical protein n=1 Tax=Brucella sp. ZJ1_1 TaxID=3379097 RepID=UPI0038531D39
MIKHPECLTSTKEKIIKISGNNKRKAYFSNPTPLDHVVGSIDGCIIKEGQRADNFIANENKIVLIEFKGKDIEHACDQLFASAEHAEMRDYIGNKSLAFLIIASHYPRAANTKVQLAQSKAKKKYKAKLKVVCGHGHCSIDEL